MIPSIPREVCRDVTGVFQFATFHWCQWFTIWSIISAPLRPGRAWPFFRHNPQIAAAVTLLKLCDRRCSLFSVRFCSRPRPHGGVVGTWPGDVIIIVTWPVMATSFDDQFEAWLSDRLKTIKDLSLKHFAGSSRSTDRKSRLISTS